MVRPITPSAAEAAIGEDDKDGDWRLTPESHAAALDSIAGSLKRVLQSPEIDRIKVRYSVRDRDASDQQLRYRNATRRTRRLGLVATIAGLFALSLHLFLNQVPDYQPLIVAVHVACLLWLVSEAALLNRRDPRAKWLVARSEAEQLRVALFDRVLAASETAQAGELPLLPLQLAYFRRYQLDVQLRYFQGRGKELDRPAGLSPWLTWPAVFVAVAGLVAGLVLLAHVAHERDVQVPDLVLLMMRVEHAEHIAALVFPLLVVSTVYTLLLSQHSVSEDARNGTRYLALYKNLAFLKGEAYEAVRIKAEAGDKETVAKFVGLVHDLMIAEQSQWISFQGIVDQKDTILAGRSAIGLAELFDGSLGASTPEPTREAGTKAAGSTSG